MSFGFVLGYPKRINAVNPRGLYDINFVKQAKRFWLCVRLPKKNQRS